MPQLLPSPWFTYLLLSWVIFSAVVLLKVLTHTFPENPASQAKHKPHTQSWDWPWH